MIKLELEAIMEGIEHAKKEILKVDSTIDPIAINLIAQFAAAKAVNAYREKLKNLREE